MNMNYQEEEKVLEKPRDGYTVSTYRLYKDSNGNLMKKEKVTTSYYPKKQGIIAVGTKEIIEETPIITPPEVDETPQQPETVIPETENLTQQQPEVTEPIN